MTSVHITHAQHAQIHLNRGPLRGERGPVAHPVARTKRGRQPRDSPIHQERIRAVNRLVDVHIRRHLAQRRKGQQGGKVPVNLQGIRGIDPAPIPLR